MSASTKANDPSCLREFLLPILCANSPSGNVGLQILDRNWGAGWNLLSLLLATKSSGRISCLDALRHPFLCGPRITSKKKMRNPTWCDRILCHRDGAEQLMYVRRKSRFSDHQPVCATFIVAFQCCCFLVFGSCSVVSCCMKLKETGKRRDTFRRRVRCSTNLEIRCSTCFHVCRNSRSKAQL